MIAIFIPQSNDKTHLISKDAPFTYPSGKLKQVLYQGTTYLRLSAGNHLIDSRDVDGIVSRRLAYFMYSFLGNKPHQNLITKIGKFATRLSPASKRIPYNGPKALRAKGSFSS